MFLMCFKSCNSRALYTSHGPSQYSVGFFERMSSTSRIHSDEVIVFP